MQEHNHEISTDIFTRFTRHSEKRYLWRQTPINVSINLGEEMRRGGGRDKNKYTYCEERAGRSKTRLHHLNEYLQLITSQATNVRDNYARIDRLFSFSFFLCICFLFFFFFYFSFRSCVQPWLIILNRKSYRIDRHAVEYARGGTPMGSHWTSPADP